uniref:Uncharacterized protein n=1 Tax=Panstrongylus lignarius TaxID=156445 RepID=A0A224Y5T7_9HEMI
MFHHMYFKVCSIFTSVGAFTTIIHFHMCVYMSAVFFFIVKFFPTFITQIFLGFLWFFIFLCRFFHIFLGDTSRI